jgi:hypothetical protein
VKFTYRISTDDWTVRSTAVSERLRNMQLTTTGEQTHRSGHLEQGCQMIYQIFIPKTPIWVCFGWPWYEKCWNILLLLGVFYDHTYVWCLYEFGCFFFFFVANQVQISCLISRSLYEFGIFYTYLLDIFYCR